MPIAIFIVSFILLPIALGSGSLVPGIGVKRIKKGDFLN